MQKEGARFWIAASILAAVIIALGWLNLTWEPRTDWDVCYEMTNKNIEWTGAGYDGIYGR